MEIEIINVSGKETGKKVTLLSTIFEVEPNDHAIYLDVKQYLANQRQGTHKSKQRNEISGSTRKLHKQKGTGGSRKGSIKNPLFKGGGRIFGPQPRDYSFKLNKKLKSLARQSALSYKAKENKIVVLEDFNFETPKTKEFIQLVNSLQLSESKNLIVLGSSAQNVYLASRNVRRSKVITASELNTYDVMNASTLILTEGSLKWLEEASAQ